MALYAPNPPNLASRKEHEGLASSSLASLSSSRHRTRSSARKSVKIYDSGWVLAIINASWRRHKMTVKEKYYKPYSDDTDRLLNRPVGIPEDHFKGFLNSKRYKQVAKEDKEPSTRAEMFFATLERKKGRCYKESYLDTQSKLVRAAFIVLEEQKENAQMTELQSQEVGESSNSGDLFAMVMPKEHPGRVRLEGRGVTKN
ncbi:hypothetical protein AKJ16_DCAP02139 [Drosera capensis]